MSMKRRRKYVCEDCGEYTFFSTYRMTSRSMPRCSYCGSTFLSPSKRSKAKEEVKEGHDIYRESVERMNAKMGKE